MPERRDGPSFSLEALEKVCRQAQIGSEHLDGHLPLQACVCRLEDFGEATSPDQAPDKEITAHGPLQARSGAGLILLAG